MGRIILHSSFIILHFVMPHEAPYTAVILKKQPYKEADEIITLYTKQAGKVRALAKSVKSPKSKLQQKLQALFFVEVILAGGKMPKIIGVETLDVFAGLRENLEALKRAFYGTELILKFTPDEQPNPQLFSLLHDFLFSLAKTSEEKVFDLILAKFKIGILEALGLSFSHSAESKRISDAAQKALNNILQTDFAGLPPLAVNTPVEEINRLLSAFIEYQLERRVKSEKYLNQGNMV